MRFLSANCGLIIRGINIDGNFEINHCHAFHIRMYLDVDIILVHSDSVQRVTLH